MTLFTMLLVIIAERLFKLGEHWHLDHRLEVLFRRIRHFSMLRTLLMMAGVMVITFLLLRALYGLFFNVPLLVVWILLGVLCIGAGKVRLHYHAYLKAASRDDAHARGAMASELTMIHGVPPDCDEREFLRELQNALLWINFRYYLAPLFWFVVGGPVGPVLLMGYAFLRAWQTWLARYLSRMNVCSPALMPSCMCSTGCRCVWWVWCMRSLATVKKHCQRGLRLWATDTPRSIRC